MTSAADPHRTQLPGSVAVIADRLEVADLLHRLAAALDERRFDDLGELFTADASVRTLGGTARGRSALVEQARRNHSGSVRTQHRMTNVLVGLEVADAADAASVRADAVIRFAEPAEPARPGPARPVRTLGEVYRCRAVRAPQGWRFTDLAVEVVWESHVP